MWRESVLLGLCLLAPAIYGLQATTQKPEANCTKMTKNCPSDECVLPYCFCSGGETKPDYADRPQIVYLTFDDAFTQFSYDNFYEKIFDGTLTNPDGAPIRATHFLTAQYTDFTLVHRYWVKGHEMASHSITHRTNQDYWKGLNVEGWDAEAEGMRRMISQFARIPKEDIQGFRAPFLQMGGDEMYTSLYNNGFQYDCSWVSRDYGYLDLDNGLFPYTMDYRSFQDCPILPCPECSYPGFWVQPMLDLEDNWIGANPLNPENGMPCSMLDGCIIMDENPTSETVKDMLMKNFLRNRNGTRAPMGLYMHAGWFYGELSWHFDGYLDFLREITAFDDVWIVPINEGIEYVRNYNDKTYQDLVDMGDASPFNMAKFEYRKAERCEPKPPCRFANVSNADIHNQERYMHICGRKLSDERQGCPGEYPWLDNPCGGNTPCL